VSTNERPALRMWFSGGVPHESTQTNKIKGRFKVCTGMGDVQSAQRVALLRDQAVLLTFGVFPGQ